MADPQPHPESQLRTLQTKNGSPDGFAEIVTKSLQVGAGTGALGALWGGASGIAIGTKIPTLITLVSGLEWFAAGSLYYGSRHMILSMKGPVHAATPVQKFGASTLSGAFSVATVAGLTRGRSTIALTGVLGSLLGGGGQLAVNLWTSRREAKPKSDSWLDWKWSPMKKLTDQEYEDLLEEKLLGLDAQIAIIDDDIAALRAQKKEQPNTAQEPPQTPPNKGQT